MQKFLMSLSLLIALVWSTRVVQGQAIQWSPDQQVPGYREDTFPPLLLADQNDTIHAFADQPVRDDDQQKAIVYRQWRLESGWTTPNDIVLMPSGGNTEVKGVLLDEKGMMHIAFQSGAGQSATLYYTRAPATQAHQAPAWSTPEPVGPEANSPSSAALAGDGDGNVVILYSGTLAGNGVYALQSMDGGESWTDPLPIFLTYETKHVPFSIHTYMDGSGRLHVVWNVVTSTGVDEAVYYARLDVLHQQWDEPVLLAERIEQAGYFGPSFPVISGYDETLVVMYNSGNPATDGPVDAGRPIQQVRISQDGGITWQEPIGPFGRHLGRSGEHTLVLDSNNVVHAIFMQRIETEIDGKPLVIDGPWHSTLRGVLWREPTQFVATVAPHDMHAVIGQGNLLLSVWREDPGSGQSGVWYSYARIDSPALSIIPLPTMMSTPTPTPTPTETPAVPTITPTMISFQQEDVAPVTDEGTATLALFATTPVLFIFGALFAARRVSRKRV